MKKITFYQCEFCGVNFENVSDCMMHEAAHLGLNKDEYLEWIRIIHEVNDASLQMSNRIHKNRSRYLNAIRILSTFEKDHGLTHENVPSSFYSM